MLKLYRFLLPIALVMLSAGAYADDIKVENAWTRATAPGQTEAMVYMSITSNQNATIVAVSSSAAKAGEMHNMEHKGGMMRMIEVKSISLPANERMDMQLHGYHLQLSGLKAPLKAGTKVPLTMDVELADKRVVKVNVQAEVKPLKSEMQMQH